MSNLSSNNNSNNNGGKNNNNNYHNHPCCRGSVSGNCKPLTSIYKNKNRKKTTTTNQKQPTNPQAHKPVII